MVIWNLFIVFNEEAKDVNGYVIYVFVLQQHYEYMKEPIKMYVEFSLLYKTLLIIYRNEVKDIQSKMRHNTRFEHC